MKNLLENKAWLAWFLIFLVSPSFAQAQGLIQCGGLAQPPCELCDIFKLITNIINFFLFPSSANNGFAIVPLVGTVFLAIGGFYFFIGGGNPQFYGKGKTIILATLTGLIIVYVSWVFLNTVFAFLGVADWTGLKHWWEIRC